MFALRPDRQDTQIVAKILLGLRLPVSNYGVNTKNTKHRICSHWHGSHEYFFESVLVIKSTSKTNMITIYGEVQKWCHTNTFVGDSSPPPAYIPPPLSATGSRSWHRLCAPDELLRNTIYAQRLVVHKLWAAPRSAIQGNMDITCALYCTATSYISMFDKGLFTSGLGHLSGWTLWHVCQFGVPIRQKLCVDCQLGLGAGKVFATQLRPVCVGGGGEKASI